eukprot:TRINITY_DN31222_c0_g1_i1.p1 TRINITY_DN31222_c0_g1~~TRINITY_DN31222_c0_g1_i1.p1  ORF type:complete len:776 (-),score=180.62 TRINITY_DN31222_c0_g1_i1:39-2366(-)
MQTSSASQQTAQALGGQKAPALALPGVFGRGGGEAASAAPPPQGRQNGGFVPPTAAAAYPAPPTHTVPQAAGPPLLGGVTSRQAEVPKAAAGAPPLLGIPPRQPEAYYTDTVMSNDSKSSGGSIQLRKSSGPVPLRRFKSSASFGSDRMPHAAWKSREGTPTSDLASSFNSAMVPHHSFKWTPGDALVQCWHKSLSETYQDYNMVDLIGEGRNGAVFTVQHKVKGQYYACKVLHKAEQEKKTLLAEIENLRKMDHPNIVRLYEVNEDREAVSLIMEYCSGGDLFSLISESEKGYLSEDLARSFAQQMLSALAYCHSRGIVHRDVKPENFLLENQVEEGIAGMLKLADFGIATSMRCAEGEKEGQVSGSIPYMAPELFTKRWGSLVRDSRDDMQKLASSDLWSCGIVIYVMLSGDLPYGNDEYRIASGEPPDFSREVWREVSPAAIDLIGKLLVPDIDARWTAQEALHHEWFTSFIGVTLPVARSVLRSLRRWRLQPWLRRLVMAGIAKRVEADNARRKFADTLFHNVKGSHDMLYTEDLVEALNNALSGVDGDATSSSALQFQDARTTRSSSSLGSGSSFSPSGKTLTGFHVRQHVKHGFNGVRKLFRLNEESATGCSPVSLSPGLTTPGSEDIVSLTELKNLVSYLDAGKTGVVDYTLFVAALLPPDLYCEENRVMEMFQQLDYKRRGQIGPEDLQKLFANSAVEKKDCNAKRFTIMVKQFDLDHDGYLDVNEFRQMLRSDEQWNEGDGSTSFSERPLTSPPSFAPPTAGRTYS